MLKADKLDVLAAKWNRFKTLVAAEVGIPLFDKFEKGLAIFIAAEKLSRPQTAREVLNPQPKDDLGGLKAGANTVVLTVGTVSTTQTVSISTK